MTITEHKRLVAEIPDDLNVLEEIEVSNDGITWVNGFFSGYSSKQNVLTEKAAYRYARRPAAAQKKRLRDEPWPDGGWRWRAVDKDGQANYFLCTPDLDLSCEWWYDSRGGYDPLTAETKYDSTDWQNSLERRPE